MRSARVTPNTVATPSDYNALVNDSSGAAVLLAHQMYGTIALPTNPSNTQTLTLDINGTNVVITFVSSIGATAGNVLIGASAAATAANLIQLLLNPTISNTTQVAIGLNTSANVTLVNYINWSPTGTSIVASSYNSILYAPATSFSASTTATGGSYTANTMKLYVEPGVVYVNGTEVYFGGGSTTAVTAPVSHPRIDVLSLDNTGTLNWTTGTENASPSPPTYPANQLPICELYNVVSETALYDNANQTSGQGYILNDVRPFLMYPINLAAVPDSIIPSTDGTYNLGSASFEWNNVYAKSGIFVAGVGVAIAKFGGLGTDGALSITSGTTTIAVSSALYFVKNYSSMSITGTASLTMSGQPSNGTILVVKSQGNVTLTSSGTVINLAGLGASAATAPVSSFGYYPTAAISGGNGTSGTSTQGPAAAGATGNADIATLVNSGKVIPLVCGGGGGNGGTPDTGFGGSVYGGGGGGGGGTCLILYNSLTANSGTITIAGGSGCQTTSNSAVAPGGVGGGAVYIECGGALNFTGTISVAGGIGGNGATGSAGGNSITGGSGKGGIGDTQSNTAGSGGGGGSGGPNAANGSGGTGGGGGASGTYFIGKNTVFA